MNKENLRLEGKEELGKETLTESNDDEKRIK